MVNRILEDLAADEAEAAPHKRFQNALLDRLDAQGRGIRAGDRLARAELHARP
jgi:hypothetical protein